MPYRLNDDDCVQVQRADGSWHNVPGGCHKVHAQAVAHLAALKSKVEEAVAEYTNKAWDGSKGRFSLEQLMVAVPAACLAWAKAEAKREDREVTKGDLKLPYKEPDGTVNLNACRAALAVLGGGRGGVDLPDDVKTKAKTEVDAALLAGKKKLGMAEAASFLEVYEPGVPLREAAVDGLVIHNVSLLGKRSLNNRVYRDQAMTDAVRLYDGAPIYIDHPTDVELESRGGIRSAHDFAGRIRNPRQVGDRVRGDIEVLDREPTKSLILSVARQMPEQAGMSHRARGELSRGDDGTEYVESLLSVDAVEFVMEPATVAGLFESIGHGPVAEGSDEDRRSVLHDALTKKFGGWGEYLFVDAVFADEGYVVFCVNQAATRGGLWRVDFKEDADGKVTIGDDPVKVRRVTTFEPTESRSAGAETTTEDTMELKELTLAQLQAGRPDIIEAVTNAVKAELAKTDETARLTADLATATAKVTTLETENAGLKTKVSEAEGREALREREALVGRKLAEAKLPEIVVNDAFRESLTEAKDEASVDALIAERKALVEAVQANASGGGPKQPPSSRVETALGEGKSAVTDADIAGAAVRLFG